MGQITDVIQNYDNFRTNNISYNNIILGKDIEKVLTHLTKTVGNTFYDDTILLLKRYHEEEYYFTVNERWRHENNTRKEKQEKKKSRE